MRSFKVGDKVSVKLAQGTFYGVVKSVMPNYNWTSETWYKVTGHDPEPFETIARRLASQ
ncbi:MAG: hypothetical protein GOVbin631_9 [Prokaryotic dsDNA virus sp.]|nr:MAG: hypothetical protein GOVbin631_9 [Prokaryotic dsDNA virus sp.]